MFEKMASESGGVLEVSTGGEDSKGVGDGAIRFGKVGFLWIVC